MTPYPFRALLAVGWDSRAVIVAVFGDREAREYLAEGCGDDLAASLVRDDDTDPMPTAGFYVWEGEAQFTRYGAGDYGGPPYEVAVDLVGGRRKMTAADLETFARWSELGGVRSHEA